MTFAAIVLATALLGAPAQALTFAFDDGGGNGFLLETPTPGRADLLDIVLVGSDAGSGRAVRTTLTATADRAYRVRADYLYRSFDSRPFWDPFGYFINDRQIQLSEDLGPSDQPGSFTAEVRPGDVFGLYVETLDDGQGEAGAFVTGEIAPIPLPATLPLIALGLGALALARRRA